MVSSSWTMVSGVTLMSGKAVRIPEKNIRYPAGPGTCPSAGSWSTQLEATTWSKSVEFTCVDGFSELAECGFCGFFAHCSLFLIFAN